MIKEEYKYSAVTEKIIDCSMKVHSTLGNGFQEVIYQRALAIELEKVNMQFVRELEMPILYDGRSIGTRRVDFLVEEKISVELKAVTQLEKVHLAQAINYLEAYNLEVGLLINFGNTRLEFKRLINSQGESSVKSKNQ
jgi:GxxExxY protein